MRNRSKSTLFLIEQLIVIAVFAICAAACITILTNAYSNARDSRDISNALLAAESASESFKAVSGDFGSIARILGGSVLTAGGADTVIVYYDRSWQVSTESDAHYMLRLVRGGSQPPPSRLLTGELTVERIDGAQLVTFPLAVISA